MSLLVNAYTRDEAGQTSFIEPNDQSYTLAGPESFRTTFYGGQTARSLGLRLLPSLAVEDLYVEGQDLSTLRVEAQILLQNIDQFTVENAETMQFRVRNILNAVELAQNAKGGVVIW